MTTTLHERIAVVETEQKALKTQLDRVEGKLDELLALRNKGAGVFWIVSTILGTGVIGILASFLSIFKGH